MTTLQVTTKQYELRWTGFQASFNYTSSNLGGLFLSEKEINDYLDEKVSQGWVVIETTVREIN